MKTRFIFLAILALSPVLCALSQIPQGFNYQAIARDGVTGNPIANATIKVKLSVLSDTTGFYGGTGGVYIWEEEHTNVKTNSQGMFTIVLGSLSATKVQGSAGSFSAIDWSLPNLFIGTKIANPTVYKVLGSAKLWSVPYAMRADDLGGSVKKLTVVGETTNMEEPIFEVKNKNGRTVFAVYNEGVRAYVSDGDAKAKKGGFAIGSFDGTKGERDLFVVSTDSIRAYIYDDPLNKGIKGGFAIGGFDPTKALTKDYLLVSPDSVRIYLDHTTGKAAKKGGFAIGSFDASKNMEQEYLRISRDSVRIYIEDEAKAVKGGFAIGSFDAGKAGIEKYLSVSSKRTNVQVKDTILGFSVTNIQGGGAADFMRIDKINAFIGHETGIKVTPSTLGDQGKYNVFLGYQSGNANTLGYRNVFMGYRAGMKNTTAENNVCIGTESGINNLTGNSNTFIGYRSGFSTTTSENTFVGHGTGYYNNTGKYNTFLGKGAGSFHESGDYNTFLGWGAGNSNDAGQKNVFIGAGAGNNNTGSSNIFIGYSADVSGTNKLWINNGFSTTPLISGDFSARKVVINGKAGDFTDPGYEFYVVGDAGGSTGWASLSDVRLKTNISAIPDALSKVTRLHGVTFDWKPEARMDEKHSVGLIAQELEKELPEAVVSDGSYMSVRYGLVSALLVEAIKEQQSLITLQKKQIEELQFRVEEMRLSLEEMRNTLNEFKSINNK